MTIGVGIVGAGSWARMIHIPTFARLPGTRVVGVAGSSPEKGRAVATEFGLAKTFDAYQDLIADPDVQVVDILVPNHLHKPVALAAFAAGKDVILIKPLAMNLVEARQIVETAERLGRKIYYAENVPFIPALSAFKSLVEAGTYGKVFRIKCMHGTGGPHAAWFSDPARSGGGCVMDMAVHGLSWLAWFAGTARPVSIYAQADSFMHDYPVEDNSLLIVRYDDGLLAVTEDSWCVPGGFDSRYEVFGTKGHGFADLLYGHPIRSVLGGNLEGGSNAVHFHAIEDHVVKDGHVAMLGHFADCIDTGAPSRSTGHDGLRIMEMVDAAYRSVREHRPIDI